jgi:hypothetical protein
MGFQKFCRKYIVNVMCADNIVTSKATLATMIRLQVSRGCQTEIKRAVI